MGIKVVGGVYMPAKKRVSSAILVGLVEIGVANVPICAYADTTSSTPFNPVSVFMAGFAVGFLIAVCVFVTYRSVARRRERAGKSLEATAEDSLRIVGVNALGPSMALEDQAASLRQVGRIALGIESDIESPKSYEALSAGAARTSSRSVREVLSRRLDGNKSAHHLSSGARTVRQKTSK